MPSRNILLAAAMAVALAFAGCLGDAPKDTDDDPGTTTSPSPTASPTASPSPSPTGTPTPNNAPIATLTANRSSGAAPLSVSFQVDASDADGDDLAWRLDADGDGVTDREGATLPATYAHNFTSAGNYTAKLFVSDGKANDTKTRDIIVSATPAPAAPGPKTFNGTITGAWLADAGYQPGSDNHTFNLTVPVKNITVNITFGDTAFDLDYALFAPDGTQVASSAEFDDPTDTFHTIDPTGFYTGPGEPEISTDDPQYTTMLGEWYVQVYPAVAVEGDYTVTVTFA